MTVTALTLTLWLLAFVAGALLGAWLDATLRAAAQAPLDAHQRRQAGIRLSMVIARLEGPSYLDAPQRRELARECWRVVMLLDPPKPPTPTTTVKEAT